MSEKRFLVTVISISFLIGGENKPCRKFPFIMRAKYIMIKSALADGVNPALKVGLYITKSGDMPDVASCYRSLQ